MSQVTLTPAPVARVKPHPFLFPQFCKSCSRCVEACKQACIRIGDEINPVTGVRPAVLDLAACTACGICIDACPEPYGLLPEPYAGFNASEWDADAYFGPRMSTAPVPEALPDTVVPLPRMEPMILKGTHASAIGALLAGCRHFYGYPITPSTEGAEMLARLLPDLGGVFVQAFSEVAAANMLYGCGGAGMRTMTFTSSPGFSLMLEGISYMIGAEIPSVLVNVMRGGPGLGNIGPEQSDIKLVCRGLGHGNTHAVVLAPASPQEMLDLTMTAFGIAFRYRNPVIIAADGYLGQITGKVQLPAHLIKPGIPEWAVCGDEMHRGNVLSSIQLAETDLQTHNIHLNAKYASMAAAEQHSDIYRCDDADWIVVAANTPSRMARGAVRVLRDRGIRAGLFRPVTLWPFPIDTLTPLLGRARGIVVVEAGPGQLEDEVRLAISLAGLPTPAIAHVRDFGGVLPQQHDIVEKIISLEGGRNGHRVL